jgi:Dolichyl-phosphate-mannose-protein mannosyltransferase
VRRRARVAALAFTLLAAGSIVVAQPLTSPWWTYADADAAYTASSLNELLGEPLRYLDHPGLPLEELGAIAFGLQAAGERAAGTVSSRRAFVDEELLHLDRARPVFRGLAVALYLLGALLSFLLAERLFGHWSWGLACGLLWLGAPGLTAMSIQFRPDVAVSVLLVVFAYLVGRAADTRSEVAYLAAAAVLGLATMTKMHAAGAVVALVVAVVWRPPPPGWGDRLRAWLDRRRRLLLLVAAGWFALAVLGNGIRGLSMPSGEQLRWLLGPPLFVAALALLASGVQRATRSRALHRIFNPFFALVLAFVLVGMWVPVTFDVADGVQALVNVGHGLSGGGINADIPLFSASLDQLRGTPLRQATVVFAVALLAGAIGVVRRDPKPVAWALGAAVLAVMAQARLAAIHYFAPAFVLSMFALLWLAARNGARVTPVLLWPLVLYVALPSWHARHGPAAEARAFAGSVAPAKAVLERRLQPGEVALVPPFWPFADARFYQLVQQYVSYVPAYPYRTLPATVPAAELAANLGLRLRYYVGPGLPETNAEATAFVGELDVYAVRRVAGTQLVYELVHGPGADVLWQRPDARYDPATGYFKDAAGQYWDAHDQPVSSPPRRRYLVAEHVWVDAYGDLWDALGHHVGTRPDLRTAP